MKRSINYLLITSAIFLTTACSKQTEPTQPVPEDTTTTTSVEDSQDSSHRVSDAPSIEEETTTTIEDQDQNLDDDIENSTTISDQTTSQEVIETSQEDVRSKKGPIPESPEELVTYYELDDQQRDKFMKIIKNNTNPQLKLDALARNIKNEDSFTEQVMYPGTPYAKQAKVVMKQDLVYADPNAFYPYQSVENFETLPYGTEVRLHKKLKRVRDQIYRGQVRIQYTDGSSVVKEVQVKLDKNLYKRPPKMFQNKGEHALVQHYVEQEVIEKKLSEANDEYVDKELYLKQLRSPEVKPVDGIGAVENLAFYVGLDVANVKEYGVAEREDRKLLVRIVSHDGQKFEGLVDISNGQVLDHY